MSQTNKDKKVVGYAHVGARLRAARLERGLSQLDVAASTGINPVSIYRFEKCGQISQRMAERLAPAVGLKVEDLATRK